MSPGSLFIFLGWVTLWTSLVYWFRVAELVFTKSQERKPVNLLLFKKSLIRNPKAKGLRVQHAVQTCLLIIFGIWMLYQLKLLLVTVNSRKNDLISSDVSENKPNYMPNKQSKMTRKSLFRVETEVVSFQSDGDDERNNDKKRDEGDEERAEENMEILDYQIGEEAETVNHRNGVHTAKDTKHHSELPLVTGRDEFESFEYSESVVDQDNKEDIFELEILEESNRIKDVTQEDADQ